MRRWVCLWPVLALAILADPQASCGMWAYVAPEVMFEEADAVVVGRVTNVVAEAGRGTIVVSETLKKGPKKIKTAEISFSQVKAVKGRTLTHSAMITFADGDEGIWALSDAVDGVYPITHPGMHYPLEKLDWVKAILAGLGKEKWGKSKKGIKASTHVRKHANGEPYIYVAVKNLSRKPVTIVDSRSQPHLNITITDPDGQARDLPLYDYFNHGARPKLKKEEFLSLRRGESRYITFRHGIMPGRLDKKGSYRIDASYENQASGEEFDLEKVWVGKTIAPPAYLEK